MTAAVIASAVNCIIDATPESRRARRPAARGPRRRRIVSSRFVANRAIPLPRVVQVTIRPSVAPAEKDDSIAPLVVSELSHGSWNRAGG